MKILVLYIILCSSILISCRERIQEAPFDFSGAEAKKNETLIKMNTYVAKRNQELITQFVKRTGLEMKETGSGLWYGIYLKGNGKPVTQGDIVRITYTLKLLDGSIIDSATVSRPKVFRSGKGGVEAGLEEGILLLHTGDHARFILPPHLAYGNFGDQKKIPPRACLFYDLYLVGIDPEQ